MSFDPRLTVTGLQEAQRANAQNIVSLRRTIGRMGRALIYGAVALHRYAVSITHADTGALRAAHRMAMESTSARIYIDPGATRPHGGRPAVYGVYEHARGGAHAFYGRTVDERGPAVVREMENIILGDLR